MVTITGVSSIAGSGLSHVTVRGAPSVTFYNNVSDIIITINSSYSNGWENYLNNVMSWNFCFSSRTSGECTGKLDTGTLDIAKNVDVYILNIKLDTEVE